MRQTLDAALHGLPPLAALGPWPRPAPLDRALWVPDGPACLVCGAAFSVGLRRHHCRRCGLLVCTACARGSGDGLLCAACTRVGGWRSLTDEQIFATVRRFRRLVPCRSPVLTADLLALAGGAVQRSGLVRDAVLADRGDLPGLAVRVAREGAAAWARGERWGEALLDVLEAALGLLGALLVHEGTPPALAALLLARGAFSAARAALCLRGGEGLDRVRVRALDLLQLVAARAAPGSEALGAAAGGEGVTGGVAAGLLGLLGRGPVLAGGACSFLASLVERCPEHAPGLVAAGLPAALAPLVGHQILPEAACSLQAARLVVALVGCGALEGPLEPFRAAAGVALRGEALEARAAGMLLALALGLPVAPPLPPGPAALVEAALSRGLPGSAPRRAPGASRPASAPRPRSGGGGRGASARGGEAQAGDGAGDQQGASGPDAAPAAAPV